MSQRPIPARAGIGLRIPHHDWVIERRPRVSWFEVHAENYMTDGTQLEELDQIARDYPISLHAVGLSLGSVERPPCEHLHRLAKLVRRYQSQLVSDHLSWSAVDGIQLPDLLPLPYTQESLAVVENNIQRVQETVGQSLLVENPSKYLTLPESTLSEAEFLAELVRRTDCRVLLDINNLFVSAANAGATGEAHLAQFLRSVPTSNIGEIHLAGHTFQQMPAGRSLRIDDHGSEVCTQVWRLFAIAIETLGCVPTLIEWDTRLPRFERLQREARIAQAILEKSTQQRCLHDGAH